MNSSSNKMDSNHTGMWVSFFTAAGIPSDVAATYALTFTENRIQNDMLLDLNKEYLRDMGITRMGDVIAILRHAKQVHESTARERVLSSASGPTGAAGGGTAGGAGGRVPVAAVVARATVAQAKPSSPATRILERYTRNAPAVEALPSTTKRKLTLSDTGTDASFDAKKVRLIRFAAPSQQPITEGPLNKQTVFARLGNSDSPKPEANNTPKPIFARLGAKAEKKADDNEMPMEKDALKYEGILKSAVPFKKIVTVTTTKNNTRKIAMGCTMRADETPISIKEKLALPKTKSVKFSNHVEYKEIEPSLPSKIAKVSVKAKYTPVFNKPERRLSMPEGVTNSVKARLGTKNTNNLTITRNIFNRLGV